MAIKTHVKKAQFMAFDIAKCRKWSNATAMAGRPKKQAADRRDTRVVVLVTDSELAQLNEVSRRRGISRSDFLMSQLRHPHDNVSIDSINHANARSER
jgi:hypothetical protein